MTNKEKAKEISESFYRPETGYNDEHLYMSAIAMAEWKEQQIIEKACEWLENNADGYMVIDEGGDGFMHFSLINDFKQAMKGE